MKIFAIILATIGLTLLIVLSLTYPFNDWNWIVDPDMASKYGSLVGGLVGSIFSLSGFLLLYQTLIEQHKQQYETRLFELVKYHRENVENFRFKLSNSAEGIEATGSQVVIEFKKQIESLFDIIRPIVGKHVGEGKDIEGTVVNASYLTFFFGVSKKTKDTLKDFLIKSMYSEELADELIAEVRKIKTHYNSKIVYYGGHQSKLGNYFRNLFNTVEYIDSAKKLTRNEKYELIKILRTQLTTYEQAILFYNSLSIIGIPWRRKNYIQNYKLIKNIPLGLTSNISPKKYYPTIEFEYESEFSGYYAMGPFSH